MVVILLKDSDVEQKATGVHLQPKTPSAVRRWRFIVRAWSDTRPKRSKRAASPRASDSLALSNVDCVLRAEDRVPVRGLRRRVAVGVVHFGEDSARQSFEMMAMAGSMAGLRWLHRERSVSVDRVSWPWRRGCDADLKPKTASRIRAAAAKPVQATSNVHREDVKETALLRSMHTQVATKAAASCARGPVAEPVLRRRLWSVSAMDSDRSAQSRAILKMAADGGCRWSLHEADKRSALLRRSASSDASCDRDKRLAEFADRAKDGLLSRSWL